MIFNNFAISSKRVTHPLYRPDWRKDWQSRRWVSKTFVSCYPPTRCLLASSISFGKYKHLMCWVRSNRKKTRRKIMIRTSWIVDDVQSQQLKEQVSGTEVQSQTW